jgi:predicted nucleic acid-binding protein
MPGADEHDALAAITAQACHQLTAYDAHYLALARSLDCPLATQLADAARAEGVAVLGLSESQG